MEKEEVTIETRTMEEMLLDLRVKKGLTYIHIVEELQKLGITTDEKTVKKWEIGLKYPDLDIIYKLSELYMVPSERFIMAKSNSYEKGMASIHMTFIKWICYITGVSIKIAYIGANTLIAIGLIWALCFFTDKVTTFMEVRARMGK